MTSNLVLSAVRRANRNAMIWSTLGLAVLAVVGALTLRYYINMFSGPRAVSASELIQITNPDTENRYYVSVDGEKALDTGVQMVSRSRRSGTERVTANYVALVVEDRLLVVKTPNELPSSNDQIPTHYEGALVAMPSDIQREVVSDIEAHVPELKGRFLPYMLDAGSFNTGGIIGLVLMVPLLLLCVFVIVRAVQRNSDPSKHPFVSRLKRFGDPAVVSSEIEAEMQSAHPQLGDVHVTRNWMVMATKSHFQAMRLSDMVWMYKQVTQRRVNGIPAGKSYAAHLFDSHGMKIEIPGKEEAVDQVIGQVYAAAPWVLAGYNADIQKAWNKDRASLVAAVAQRRQQAAMAQ